MTVKKGLENRIRGWFPHDPTMISTGLKVTRESKQPPLMIPSEYKVSATKFLGGLTIFWITFYGYFFFYAFNIFWRPISVFQIVAWIIVGLVFGVISHMLYTKNQLSRLSKDYQFTMNGRDGVLLIVPMVLFFVFTGVANSFLYSSSQVWLISVYTFAVSGLITRIILLAAFEKKENMRLMQSWWGSTIFLVPKAPNSNTTV